MTPKDPQLQKIAELLKCQIIIQHLKTFNLKYNTSNKDMRFPRPLD